MPLSELPKFCREQLLCQALALDAIHRRLAAYIPPAHPTHVQASAVVRVLASEVGHLGRLLEPLVRRAARRLGQLLEAKAGRLEPFQLGPLPALEAGPGQPLLLPCGYLGCWWPQVTWCGAFGGEWQAGGPASSV
jgi:hypothetical protein